MCVSVLILSRSTVFQWHFWNCYDSDVFFYFILFQPMKTTFCSQYYKDAYPSVSLLSMMECSVSCGIVCTFPFVDSELLKLLTIIRD